MAERSMSRREALRITAVTGLSAAFGGALAVGILRDAGLHRVSETRTRMGTVVTLTVVHPDARAARVMGDSAFQEMTRIEGVLSRHRADSAVGRLNAEGRLVAAPRELVEVLGHAEEISKASEGAFDVTVAPLLSLFERSFEHGGSAPSDDDVLAAVALVDYRGVRRVNGGVVFDDPRMSLTLDGIAKGYIVDRTIDVLTTAGAERVLVNAGGDMSTAGPGSRDEPWTIGLQDPHSERDVVGFVRLGGECIATSGDYMQSFTEDRTFHHIVDPRTGRSPEETSSVSVVAGSAMEADALSTTVLVLGPRDGLAMLEGLGNTEGVIVTKSGDRHWTPGMHSTAGRPGAARKGV